MILLEAVTAIAVAAVLWKLGRWGRRYRDALVPAYLPASEREHRARVLSRGAVTSQAVAVLFTAAAALLLYNSVT